MGHFQKGINILEVDVPKPENLYLVRMGRREIEIHPLRAEEKLVVAAVKTLPGLPSNRVAYLVIEGAVF